MTDKKNGFVWEEKNDFSKVLIIFLSKNLHRIQSIKILCKKGLAKDAIPLLRGLFEELVDLKYMDSNRSVVKDFLDYDTYLRLKLGKGLLKQGGKGVDKKKVKKRNHKLQKKWDKVRSRFIDKNGDVHRRWTCMGVSSVSEKVGLGGDYFYLFGYLSNYVHSSSLSGNDYVLGRHGEDVLLEIGTSRQFIPEVLITASVMYVEMIRIVNDEYKMGLNKKLDKLVEEIHAYKNIKNN